MHEVLTRSSPEQMDKETRAMLEKRHTGCKVCQYLAPKPFVVKVSVPREEIIFNSKVVIDKMWIQGRHVTHIMDKAIHFHADRIILDDSTKKIWYTFMQM